MPGPSDIRVNPFNNATNYVNLTERHIVPSVSPFVVRLNEVPEKQDPSNMQMYYVDDTTGQTTENVLTEVAATPGAGEFRPDYSTNAFDDTSWNTGLIEFSSSDAGKIIEVSYTATGTLAGVKTNRYPAWWLDRGDGSDGDFMPESNVTISGLKQYKSVFIKAGVTVTVDTALLLCQGYFVNNGTITADGQGAPGGSGGSTGHSSLLPIWEPQKGCDGFCGAGGKGGDSKATLGAPGGYSLYNNIDIATRFPSSMIGAGGGGGGVYYFNDSTTGGKGGNGGGSVIVVAAEFKNMGIISANGASGSNGNGSTNVRTGGGGGGGGGGVFIVTNTLIASGVIRAEGGEGGTGYNSGSAGTDGIAKILVLD